MSILVTGGAGYIGSHTCVELLNQGHDIVMLDNFYNSNPESVNRVKELGQGGVFKFYRCDILDREGLDRVFSENEIDAVIHFAGLKAVGESVSHPVMYYRNNFTGTVTLLEAMQAAGVKTMVFSSSATIYGVHNPSPYEETMPAGNCTNPYGWTKLMIERILTDLCQSDAEWRVCALRYFNPVGAHKSGRIGENPNGIPNNLMPYITQVAVGKLNKLRVFGNDYDTVDGTGVRDYIHVVDLAVGHIKALRHLRENKGLHIYNLGTGKGTSVLELVREFEVQSGRKIPYEITGRRDGDLASYYANAEKAKKELGFETKLGIDRMCADSWRWQMQNPNGLQDSL